MTLAHVVPPLLAGSERDLLRDAVRQLLDQHLPVERVLDLDEVGTHPDDVWRALGAADLLALGVDTSRGGSDGTVGDSAVVTAELAARFPSLAVDYVLCGMLARTLTDQRVAVPADWMPGLAAGKRVFAYGLSEPHAGTDLLALRTRARLDGGDWVVDGRKLWTSLAAQADSILVLARTDDPVPGHRASGLSLIAVPTDQPGVEVRRLRLAAMRAAGTCEVFLDGARAPGGHLVGPRGGAMALLRATLTVERVLSACISLGIGTEALQLAVAYAAEREAFGTTIGAFQAVQHPLAMSAAELCGAVSLVERAVAGAESGADATVLASMAKLVAAETTARVTDRAMRVVGAHGLSREGRLQMLFRDARLQLFSPVSNEMVLSMVAEQLGLPRSY